MKDYVILGLILLFSSVTLYATAQDSASGAVPTTCVEEKIAVEKLKQTNAQLLQQVMQAQFQQSTQMQAAAKAEEARLQGLLPKKEEPKADAEKPEEKK